MLVAGKMQQTAARDGRKGPRRLVVGPGLELERADQMCIRDRGMYVRGKRRMFDERTCPGMAVQVRIGRVHPLYNEIQILEAVSMDG